MIPTIISAGALGVSIFCIIKVYNLLKKEQEQTEPRTKMLNAIYVFAGFGLIMTLVSLGIEYSRHWMKEAGDSKYINELSKISKHGYYSMDTAGNPMKVEFMVGDSTFLLAKPVPDHFINPPIAETPNSESAEINPTDLLSLGIFHAPEKTTLSLVNEDFKDKESAMDYLIKLLDFDKKLDVEKDNAIKVLTQPDLMNDLDQIQYKSLINALNSGLRESPYHYFELAQVYLSRSRESWMSQEEKISDWIKCRENLISFQNDYESFEWMRDADRENERNLYLKADTLRTQLEKIIPKDNI